MLSQLRLRDLIPSPNLVLWKPHSLWQLLGPYRELFFMGQEHATTANSQVQRFLKNRRFWRWQLSTDILSLHGLSLTPFPRFITGAKGTV